MILCLDTAISQTSVGLCNKGELVDSLEGQPALKASEVLHTMIDDLLKSNGLKPSDLKAVAVNGGPGSYTGLRIGASAAKGLCYGLDIPLIHIDGLRLMAYAFSTSAVAPGTQYLVPMIDARRDEVFTAVYDRDLVEVKKPGPMILERDSFNVFNNMPTAFFGNGALKAQNLINNNGLFTFSTLDTGMSHFANLAWEKWEKKNFENSITYVPKYLKKFHFVGQNA